MGEVIEGRFRRTVSRVIGQTLQRAARDYDCSKCICPIFRGQEYIREVHLFKHYNSSGVWSTEVTVRRYHCYCPDDGHRERLEIEMDNARLA